MENRIEELEGINDKNEFDLEKMRKSHQGKIDNKVKELESILKEREDTIAKAKDGEIKLKREIDLLRKQLAESALNQTRSVDSFQIINLESTQHKQNPQDLNKTQPMIIKHDGINVPLQIQQMRKIAASNQIGFGSYSSQNSFKNENNSPDRRTTPDITHPYLHQTQVMPRRKTVTPGTSLKSKKFMPGSVAESFGLQPSLNSAINTYQNGGNLVGQGGICSKTGKVIGQRKLSSQHSRNTPGGGLQQSMGKTAGVKGIHKNSWMSSGGVLQGGQLTMNGYPPQSHQHPQQFSNIINNNIQGLSINYSNQIIAPPVQDPVQQFANNFMPFPVVAAQNINQSQEEDSESSNLNSHRRCKSQNVRRAKAESALAMNKKETQKLRLRGAYLGQGDQDEMLMLHTPDVVVGSKDNYRSMGISNNLAINHGGDANNLLEETYLGAKHFGQHDLHDQQMHRNFVHKHHVNSVTSNTLSAENTHKVRTASNRVHSNVIDEQQKNRFNQSYGGSTTAQIKKGSISTAVAGGGIVIHSRNGNILGHNTHSTNQSLEKTSLSRSRNKKHIIAHHTVGLPTQQQPTFESSGMIDMNFKTGNQKQAQSTTNNTSMFINSNNMQMLRQQIMAQKKASNLLMKGISPLKK